MSTSVKTDLTSVEGPQFITRIKIAQLYDTYTYDIHPKSDVNSVSQLMILYGDNGTGKTTILNLLYSALATTTSRSLKTGIANTPFKIFEIYFNDSTRIKYEKKDGLIGSFYVSFYHRRKTIKKILVETADDGAVKIHSPGYDDLVAQLKTLGIEYYFLSDDRTFKTTLASDIEQDDERWLYDSLSARVGRNRSIAHFRDEIRVHEVFETVARLESWFRQKALQGSNQGEETANTLLMDVLRHISQEAPQQLAGDSQLDDIQRVRDLSYRSESFGALGLRPGLPAKEITKILRDAPADVRPIVRRVLNPFLGGFEARLDALQEIHDLIRLFLDTINSYLFGKLVTFSLRRGLEITPPSGVTLSPRHLSSGEKQLLLLLCNTVIARDHKSLFIIDEPELSLNIKWQRQLLDSLAKCAGETPNQFLIATHSLELLSRHSSEVVQLD
jgi:energy-coupling factor transporter ATP-binding protein EcfA2